MIRLKTIKNLFYSLILLPLLSVAGDIENGKLKSASCAACHGDNGVSANPVWPKLAGQNAKYLASQLYEFRKGSDGNRNNAVMYGIAAVLSDDDIEDLSAYYESLEKSIGTVDDKYWNKVRTKEGMQYSIQACMACHGPNGQRNSLAGIPMLSGQHSEYIYTNLKFSERYSLK